MSNMYAIKEETLSALGDAIRTKLIGTSDCPTLNVEAQYIDNGKAYIFELPNYVKKVQINGFVKFSYNSETFSTGINGTQGLGVAPGVFGTYDHRVVRADENYKVVWEGYPADERNAPVVVYFETEVEGNQWAFVATKDSSSPLKFSVTFTAIGLDENNNEFKFTPAEMADKINGLDTISETALNITGSCRYRFAENNWNWFIENYGDKITTDKVTNPSYMFSNCTQLKTIPFDINIDGSDYTYVDNMFNQCNKLLEMPQINYLKLAAGTSMFNYCQKVRYFPEGFGENWDYSYIHSNTGSLTYLFSSCYSLRKIPTIFNKKLFSASTASYSSCFQYRFNYCLVLDEIVDLCVPQFTYTSNMFSSAFNYCFRLKDMLFETNEDGTPKTANWKSQTIDLSTYVGVCSDRSSVIDYNSGITADKQVTDDASYQALKNDPDWFTTNINYSRYNHDSAVNTINSLPDCSAYGTNIIKFKGASGALTDGGAINTLTEEEIAVATAKGWTVSLV